MCPHVVVVHVDRALRVALSTGCMGAASTVCGGVLRTVVDDARGVATDERERQDAFRKKAQACDAHKEPGARVWFTNSVNTQRK